MSNTTTDCQQAFISTKAPYDIYADFARIKARHDWYEAEFSARPKVRTVPTVSASADAFPVIAYDFQADIDRIKARHEQTEAKLAAAQLQVA